MNTPKFPSDGTRIHIGGKLAYAVPTEKRVRAFVKSTMVADSSDVIILITAGIPVSYFFPKEDVYFSSLRRMGEGNDNIGNYELYGYYDTGKKREEVARLYTDTESGKLLDYVSLSGDAIDRWMEEDEVVNGHPRDPYTRIDIRQSRKHIEVYKDGEKIADSAKPRMLFETGLPVRYYIPAEDVRLDLFKPSEYITHCPYKGYASYWDLEVGGKTVRNAAWSYLTPYDEAIGVKGNFCFYMEKFDRILIDGKRL